MATEHGAQFTEILILLGAVAVSAPIFKRIGMATVLGYIAAGIVLGPIATLIIGGEDLLDFGELGVVLLLFVIGLELKPSRLWAMRRDIFGLGAAQVIVTGLVLTGLVRLAAGLGWEQATIIGMTLALSSTAFALQLLDESQGTNQRYGQTAFSILLFQDLAIVPLLALVPLLAPGTEDGSEFGFRHFAFAVGAIAALIATGRYLLNPLFRVIANTGAREAMIAAALFVVLGAATLMQSVGLSMAMGAFVAGVMLAESSYRHELETSIEPFRGILLAVFFMAVGLSLDIDIVLAEWLTILVAVPVLMLVKAVICHGLCRAFGSTHADAVRVALLLPQGGEFGFVIFSAATAAVLLPPELSSLLIAVITVTMVATPLAVSLGRFLIPAEKEETMEEDFEGAGSDVLMIGFSRFGQIASQVLLSGGARVTIIDHSANRVRAVEKFGFRIYFGDGRRKDVLEAAGIREARIVAVCTHGREGTDQIVNLIQSEFPHVRLFVRSYDRDHTLSLRARDVEYEIRETLESGLLFGRMTLQAVGIEEETAADIVDDVRHRDEERLSIQAAGLKDPGISLSFPEPLVRPKREGRRIDRLPDGPDETEPARS
ncbi:potassium transporter TrkA [Aquibium carbonis]|uniref:Potassium transporter TrkA n=1 Tax=Aquibium carbonis TaxID=2495581 RepID=A0A429Z088_9HYPH|nr:monovalent cation:proton antiporter-2 (CPA2) family protein [Aquibium carbonis]RST87018.1 potassium transporter TrkA [Aquibium carbonis]